MTDEELKRLEALCERYADGPADGTQAEMRHEFATALPAALAEIRRFKSLLKTEEWSGAVPEGWAACVWCSASYDHAGGADVAKHAADCPVFTPDGTVR